MTSRTDGGAGTGAFSLLQPISYDVPTNYRETDSLKFIATCLKECMENHGEATETLSELPRRVIEITNVTSIRLVEPEGQRGRYMTLSHRWGGSGNSTTAPKKTTRQNIRDHQTDIAVNQLTPAMQDAIAIAHWLGIRYIWIDSLCIIQDDIDDWVSESAKMSRIYSQSTLTVFATSTAGCFIPREGFRKKHYNYTDRSHGRAVELVAHDPLQHSHVDRSFREVAANNLFKRGWAFQEWLLNPRAIVFGSDELLWCCDHAVRCECTPTPRKVEVVSKDPRRYKHNNLLQTRIAFRLGLQQRDVGSGRWPGREEDWLRLAQIYSATRLTFETDRLPALSGLAKLYCGSESDVHSSFSLHDYLAGCWRDHHVPALLWYSVPPRGPSDPKFIDMRRTTYIAPSWSWMSLPYYVKFFYLDKDPAWASSAFRELVSIKDVRCFRATEDPTGSLKGGSLTISGPTCHALLIPTVEGKQNPKLQVNEWTEEVYGDHGSIPYFRFLAESDRRKAAAVDVTCLIICAQLDKRNYELHFREIGLILLPSSEQPNCYERVGLFDIKRCVVVGPKDSAQAWRQAFGINGFGEATSADFDSFLGKLREHTLNFPGLRDAVLPRTTERTATIV